MAETVVIGSVDMDDPAVPVTETGIPVQHIAEDRETAPDVSLTSAFVAARAAGIPLRLRMALQLWHAEKRQYVSWRGQVWKLDVTEKAAAQDVQIALERFFDAVARFGATGVIARLEEVLHTPMPVGAAAAEREEQGDGRTNQ